MVLNVLHSYFDFYVKKDKLKWTGSFEDLKELVLTVIDEETAKQQHGDLPAVEMGL